VTGQVTETSQGQWGGVVLMGRAPVTDCTTGTVASGTCERQTEGAPIRPASAATTDAYNSGPHELCADPLFGLHPRLERRAAVADHRGRRHGHHAGPHPEPQQLGRRFRMVRRQPAPEVLHRGRRRRRQPRRRYRRADERAVRPAAPALRPGRRPVRDRQQRLRDRHAAHQAAGRELRRDPDRGQQQQRSRRPGRSLFRGNSDVTLVNGVYNTPNNECIRMNGSGTTPATLTRAFGRPECNATKYLGHRQLQRGAGGRRQFGSGANNNNDALHQHPRQPVHQRRERNRRGRRSIPRRLAASSTPPPGSARCATAADTWYAGWTCNSAPPTSAPAIRAPAPRCPSPDSRAA
jgi:hypothetical protein